MGERLKRSPLHYLDVERKLPPKLSTGERVLHFKEIFGRYQQNEAASQAERCIDCGNPYCSWSCPVQNHIPQWLELLARGRLFEAAELCHQTNSLPEICGRICPQDRLCEGACTLNDGFGAVSIGALERYICDEAVAAGWSPDLSEVRATGQRVAVIGAGPAGLGCADVLARNGIEAHVFDRYSRIGGLLTWGIPPFKLDKDVVERRRELLEAMGVRFHLGQNVGEDEFRALERDYDAIFLGTGAYRPVEGSYPGESAPGVIKALDFLIENVDRVLRDADASQPILDDQRVVVLGGGDTAMDCVRTSIRLGARSVHCVYRREREQMPGSQNEVAYAFEEGINFLFDHQIESISTRSDQCADGVMLSHRGERAFLPADKVIIAFGFRPDPPAWFAGSGVALQPDQRIVVNAGGRLLQQTSCEHIFAGGDNVRGADLVVRAVFDGRAAATSITSMLADREIARPDRAAGSAS